MSEGLPARRAALQALAAVEEHDAYANLVVPGAVDRLEDARDRAFASHLAYDTLRWQGTLDWLLEQVVDRPLTEVEPALRRILRLGVLQLWRTEVPQHAAVATSVEIARGAVPRGRAKGAAGFVNGVLRNVARHLERGITWPEDPVEAMALRTAHPTWVVEDARARFGERAEAVLAADNDPPGLTLRATGDRGALVEELRAAGLEAEPGLLAPEAVRVPGADPRRIPAVEEGRATPQDEASMVVAHATGVRPGDRVLDLCAGPGGKSAHLAALAGPEGHVVAVELHEHRAEMVRETARRLGVEVDVRVGDARTPPLEAAERFDVVLVDAPCTGLGTGRRRPEVRWRRVPDDVDELAELQRQLLTAAARWLRPGGRLTYAVCTWTRGETDGIVESFADEAAARELGLETTRQLLPDGDATDGMFMATWESAVGPGSGASAR